MKSVDKAESDDEVEKKPTSRKQQPGGQGKTKKKPRQKPKRTQKQSPPESSKPEASDSNPPPAASGFGDGNKALEAAGLGISGRIEEVFSVPRSEKFFQFVDQCYDQLCAAKHELQFILTRAEWRHIHALFFYGRLQNIEFEQTGKKQPAPTRIPLPYDVRVFQPIWAVLSDIGVVQDPELHVRYIPIAKMPRTADQHDIDDLEEIIDCLQYNWCDSWAVMQEDRQTRLDSAPAEGVYESEWNPRPQPISQADFKEAKARAIATLSELKQLISLDWDDDEAVTKFRDYAAELSIDKDDGTIYLGEGTSAVAISSKDDAEAGFKAVLDTIHEMKRSRLSVNYPEPRTEDIEFTLNDERLPNDPGSYGRWLGWDPQLWLSYRRFVDVAQPIAMWSPSFPREVTGTYMWLLPVESGPSGIFSRLPKNSIPNPVWLLALILDMSTLNTNRTHTFYVYTDATPSTFSMTNAYIRAAITSGAPVEVFR